VVPHSEDCFLSSWRSASSLNLLMFCLLVICGLLCFWGDWPRLWNRGI
jgi:hypothetical protein